MLDRPLEIVGCWVMLLLVSSLFSALAYPAVSRWIAAMQPATRSAARLLLAVSTPLIATVATFLLLRPTLFEPTFPITVPHRAEDR